jgi:hypothetical protein
MSKKLDSSEPVKYDVAAARKDFDARRAIRSFSAESGVAVSVSPDNEVSIITGMDDADAFVLLTRARDQLLVKMSKPG